MIPKPCKLPLSIEKYQALIRRLLENNLVTYDVVTEFNNRMTGFRGEESVMNFHLEPIWDSHYRIYHDIRLLLGKYYFQIDILILCTYFLLVLEVKNRARDWYFDKVLNQATFDKNGVKERTRNPVFQARLQAFKLKEWLREHNITGVPIQYLFVNSNEKANIIITDDNYYKWNICNSEFLLERIDQITKQYKIETLDEKGVKKINKLLLSNTTPENPDLLQKYGLSPKGILPGVHCPKCNFLPMFYHAGKWKCPKCRIESKTAFIDSLRDYLLLIDSSITNSEARRFLQIDSPKICHHSLSSLNLPYTGKFRDRVYHLHSLQ
jgi:hypothetical protein